MHLVFSLQGSINYMDDYKQANVLPAMPLQASAKNQPFSASA